MHILKIFNSKNTFLTTIPKKVHNWNRCWLLNLIVDFEGKRLIAHFLLTIHLFVFLQPLHHINAHRKKKLKCAGDWCSNISQKRDSEKIPEKVYQRSLNSARKSFDLNLISQLFVFFDRFSTMRRFRFIGKTTKCDAFGFVYQLAFPF